ncbi:MAG: hypothetical protein WBG29_16495 [Candidatus Acidiferrales bacterium]
MSSHLRTKVDGIKVGSGGSIIKWPDGRTAGPIGGESLRVALSRGAVVVEVKKTEAIDVPTEGRITVEGMGR